MSFNWIDIFLLIGSAQGLFLTAIILHKYGNLFANRFLAVLIGLFSVVLLNLFLSEVGVYNKFPYIFILLDGIPLMLFPLYYLYARYLIHQSTRLSKPEWLHFLPFLIYKLYSLTDLFKSRTDIMSLVQNVKTGPLHGRYMVYNWVIAIQGMIYVLVTLVILFKYSKQIKNIFSSIEKVKLNWFRNITIMAAILMFIFLTEQSLLTMGINLSHFFDLTSFLFAIFIYVIGYMGFLKSEIFMEPEVVRSLDTIFEKDIQAKKYQKSSLPVDKAKSIVDNLVQLMEKEKLYKNSDLTLTRLAELLKISPHNLSESINTQLNQNFFDFINQYRVEQVKEDLADLQKQHLTFLAIAMDVGFNSKSTFNSIFKKYTGMTPSEYRRNLMT